MSYTAPTGSQVPFNFTVPGYTPPVGSQIPFVFSSVSLLSMLPAVTGEVATAELLASIPLGILTVPTGETIPSFLFSVAYQLPLNTALTGEISNTVTIHTTYQLGTLPVQEGQKTACTFTTFPGNPLGPVLAVTGEVASSALWTQSTLFSAFNTGELLTPVLTTFPLILFSTNVMPTGEHIGNSLAAFNQFTSSIRTGEVASCVLTATGPIIILEKTGEVGSVNLTTDVLLAPNRMFTGESIVSTTLTPNPAFHPTVTFLSGEKASLSTIKTFYHAVMSATAHAGEEFWAATSDQTRWIDLAYDRNPADSFYTWWDDVNNQMGNWIIIDGFENEFPSIIHDVGINQFATAELSTRARFTATARAGESMINDLSARILNAPPGTVTTPPPIKILTGVSIKCQLEADIKIPLCFGNIIPDPDFVFIEMSSPYGDGCESWWMRTGEVAFVARGGFHILPSLGHPVCNTGEVAIVTLTPDPPWIAKAQTGEQANAILNTTVLLPTNVMHTGEIGTFRFQDMTVTFNEGAIAFVASMHTNYDVFLDEQGCLNNEFVPQTVDGDNDFANAPPASPRELDPFQHFILAHCE